jgi:poly-gamma-glutamate capsule biosynthesis protein CapA/YwtB (metallophosphatase superfamily)
MEKDTSSANSNHLGDNSLIIRGVGDIMVIAGAARALEKNGCEYLFGSVAPLIHSADLAFGNLEMPISSNPNRHPYFPDVCPDFYSPAQTANALEFTGFDVLNLANNHIMDWGVDGLQETLLRLQDVGIQTIGAGENLEAAHQPALFTSNNMRVGFLGYGVRGPWNATKNSPGTAPIDRKSILLDIRDLRSSVDLVVVSLHTGILSHYPNPEDRHLAHDLIDHGVDLILGHGPHVIQGIEIYQGKAIYFSLGNFMIDLASGNVENKIALAEHLESFIADVRLSPVGRTQAHAIPIVISGQFQATQADPARSTHILANMDRLSQTLSKMRGLTLWEHAGALNVEHELRVLVFQGKHVSLIGVLRRLTKIRWRHLRLLVGYLIGKLRKAYTTLAPNR